MATSDLQNLCLHINNKISAVTKTLQLRRIGEEPSLKAMLCKIGKDLIVVQELLHKLEMEVYQQEEVRDNLKDLQISVQKDLQEAQHLCENIGWLPAEPPSAAGPAVKSKDKGQAANPEPPKKPGRDAKLVKQMALITEEEFRDVPAYMKGRISYEQVNTTLTEINKAVQSKYKILKQPLKSMNTATRNLYHRFKEEETDDTKGEFFVVEADIKEFTQQKADKRFHIILSILRHCHRLREVRGPRIIRYVIY